MHYLEWSFKCFVMSISAITHHVISFLCDKLEYVLSTLLPFLFTFLLSRGGKKSRCSSDKYLFFWEGRLYTLEKRAFQSLEVNEENFRRNQRMSSAEKHYLMQAKKYVIFVIHSSAHISVFGASRKCWVVDTETLWYTEFIRKRPEIKPTVW